MSEKSMKPCSYCNLPIPAGRCFGDDPYTDVPGNHALDCPIREIMEVRLENERRSNVELL
jgi:hypothetical protein